MNQRMRRALRRAGCALTAGLLGVAGPALAQGPSPYRLSPFGASTHYATQYVSPLDGQPITNVTSLPAGLAEGSARLEEIKVELALLTDPATFSWNLGARMQDTTLQVRGFVPNAAVKARALEVARAATGLEVNDGLRIHPSLAMRSAAESVAALEKGAAEVLRESFGDQAKGLEVKAKATGQITVSGHIKSYEEKLAVSRALRKVRGCSCVNNQLNVIPMLRDGKQFSMVTADGEHLVSVETMEETPNLTPGAGHVPVVQSPAHPPAVQTLKPTYIPPTLTTPRPSSKLAPVPARTPGSPPLSLLPPAGPEPPEIDPLAPPPTTPVPPGRTTTQAMGITPQKTIPLALPATPPVPRSLSSPAPASPFSPVTPRWTTPTKPAAPGTLPAPRTAAPADKKSDQSGAYVATGTVTFASAETVEPPVSGRASPERVKERVQSVCGRAASHVEVSQQGQGVLLIKMRVPSNEEGHRLHKKIAEMPELAGYEDWKINMVVEPRK